MPRSIDQLDFAGLALLSRTYSTFRAPFGVPHYLLYMAVIRQLCRCHLMGRFRRSGGASASKDFGG